MLDNPYLKLLRIPNIFTVPADIILGFLIALALFQSANMVPSDSHIVYLIILIISSILLYLGGLVSNDLFDIKTDKIERPNRPLSSGKVKKRNAIILLIVFLGTGFVLSLFTNLVTAGTSGVLILSIVLYNYKLKSGFFRPFIMGAIRSLNIFYGFSSLFSFSGQTIFNTAFPIPTDYIYFEYLMLLSLVLVSVFFHIFMLTWISSKETSREFAQKGKKVIRIRTVYYIYITFLLIIGFSGFYLVGYFVAYLFFILGLGLAVSLIFYKADKMMLHLQGSLTMQFVVKNMLLLLILLDSAFIAGISGPVTGFATALLILPCIYLSKKISMT